jgi:hypothetical protein
MSSSARGAWTHRGVLGDALEEGVGRSRASLDDVDVGDTVLALVVGLNALLATKGPGDLLQAHTEPVGRREGQLQF